MYPILQFDPSPSAIINPTAIKLSQKAPVRAVMCFFQDVLRPLAEQGRLRQIGQVNWETGPNPIYIYEADGSEPVLVVHPGVGAPLAAGYMEEIIACGCNRIIACGGCGSLHPEITVGYPLVLTAAVRDEGTSYHYLPPSREITAQPGPISAIEAACRAKGVGYRLVKSWTTDAVYRETAARRALRLAEGCDVVEMEASAFLAVAEFRGISFGQILYGGDLVVPEGWDERGWSHRSDDRRIIFELALAAALNL
jgi:uridine phosphorylase